MTPELSFYAYGDLTFGTLEGHVTKTAELYPIHET